MSEMTNHARTGSRRRRARPVRRSTCTTPAQLDSVRPALPDWKWSQMETTPFLFVGAGAVNRPLARQLAGLGMRQALVVDPKRYKPQSVASQCAPDEVGREKATTVADELRRMGVKTLGIVGDIDDLPPGYVEPETVVITAVDNRRGDICANRLAVAMQARLVKVNVEPAYLMGAVSAFDYRSGAPDVCLECRLTDRHYRDQRHPLSCDGGGPQTPTGSPRALSEMIAGTAALAIAQIVCSPDRWGQDWFGKLWRQQLLGGQGGFAEIPANPACRCDHCSPWTNMVRIAGDVRSTSLAELAGQVSIRRPEDLHITCSSPVAFMGRCDRCQRQQPIVRWIRRLNAPVTACECGGGLLAVPFFACREFTARRLESVWELPLAEWGVADHSIVRLTAPDTVRSFVL